MADADIVKTEYGYVVGGTGTDDTEVVSSRLRVKAFAFAGNADNATGVVTTKDGSDTYVDATKFKTNGNDLDVSTQFLGDDGVPFNGLKVNLSHANDRLYIYVK